MSERPDVLRPTAEAALQAWAARVRANRDQVEAIRETFQTDFYAGITSIFRADRTPADDPILAMVRALVRPDETLLDIGAGGGRYAVPLATSTRAVIALDPSPGMLQTLRDAVAERALDNVRVVEGRWPADAADLQADVSLISHVGYDVEDIGPFLDAMERATRRQCIAVLLERPPPTPADDLWPVVHGLKRAALPALPEFLNVLLARNRLFELRLMERPPQPYAAAEQALAWLRGQLWTRPGSDKDLALQRVLLERLQPGAHGGLALSTRPTRVGVVTWQPGSDSV